MAGLLLLGDGEIAYILWSATMLIADAPSLFILPGIGLFFGFVREDATHSSIEPDVKAKKHPQKV